MTFVGNGNLCVCWGGGGCYKQMHPPLNCSITASLPLPDNTALYYGASTCAEAHIHCFAAVQANLKNAILERAVFTRSDLGGALIDGADFTNALLDKTQQMVSPAGRGGGQEGRGVTR
jgi:hypothetical protein